MLLDEPCFPLRGRVGFDRHDGGTRAAGLRVREYVYLQPPAGLRR